MPVTSNRTTSLRRSARLNQPPPPPAPPRRQIPPGFFSSDIVTPQLRQVFVELSAPRRFPATSPSQSLSSSSLLSTTSSSVSTSSTRTARTRTSASTAAAVQRKRQQHKRRHLHHSHRPHQRNRKNLLVSTDRPLSSNTNSGNTSSNGNCETSELAFLRAKVTQALRREQLSTFSLLEEHFTCSLCCELLAHPVSVTSHCGHVFCAICLIMWIFSRIHEACGFWHSTPFCPICRTSLCPTPYESPRSPYTLPLVFNRTADTTIDSLLSKLSSSLTSSSPSTSSQGGSPRPLSDDEQDVEMSTSTTATASMSCPPSSSSSASSSCPSSSSVTLDDIEDSTNDITTNSPVAPTLTSTVECEIAKWINQGPSYQYWFKRKCDGKRELDYLIQSWKEMTPESFLETKRRLHV